MSDATPPTDPNALLFPAFLYGAHGTCRRKMKAEAKKWAKRYLERGEFPEVKRIPVPAGSIMYCDRSSFEMLADTDPELKHREWLKTPGLIEAELAHTQKTNPDWYEDLKTGRCIAGLLSTLEKKYPNG